MNDANGSDGPTYDQPVINHVGQCTTDLDVATRFYCELLGFELERDLTVPDEAVGPLLGVEAPVGLRAVYLRRGGFTLELMHFDRPGNPDWTERRFNEPGLTHLSLSVVDLPKVVGRVASSAARWSSTSEWWRWCGTPTDSCSSCSPWATGNDSTPS